SSSAAKLHRGLIDKHVYVTLYAWTNVVAHDKKGVEIETRLHTAFLKQRAEYSSTDWQDVSMSRLRKSKYTKVVFTCKNGVSAGRLHGYEEGVTESGYLEESLQGRQLLWANWVIDRIVHTLTIKVQEDLKKNPNAPLAVIWEPHCHLQQI